jgi:hypothetical protein
MAIGADLFRFLLASSFTLGQLPVLGPACVTPCPLLMDVLLQPFRGDRCEHIQGVAHRLANKLQAVQAANDGQDAGGVGALLAPSLDQPHLPEPVEQMVEKQPFVLAFQQTATELREHRGVKAGIVEFKGEGIFPVDAGPDGVGGLPVGKTFCELHDCHQGKPPRRHRWLAAPGEQVGEVLVLEDRTERVPHGHIDRAKPRHKPRDRSNIYREGLAKGAPGATHVADRWHLLHNLTLTLEEYLLQKRSVLQKAAAPEAAPEDKDDADYFASGPIMPNRPRTHDRKIEEAARKRHERLVEQWKNIRRLYLAGADLRDICRQLGISARTVYRYKDLTEPPPRLAYKRRASVLDPYVPYLVRRWNEGCHNGKKLYREIREQGYRNSEETCARFTAQLRRAEARGKPISSVPRARQGSVAGLSPTAKNVAALFMRHEEKLDEEQERYLDRVCEADEALADTRRLTQEFAEMVRKLEGEDLDGWLKDAEESGSTAMRSFAAGLRKDLDAVRAGLTEEWSNGCVEGFVHKLKLLKRQGYGRAGFKLLRARMLAA